MGKKVNFVLFLIVILFNLSTARASSYHDIEIDPKGSVDYGPGFQIQEFRGKTVIMTKSFYVSNADNSFEGVALLTAGTKLGDWSRHNSKECSIRAAIANAGKLTLRIQIAGSFQRAELYGRNILMVKDPAAVICSLID